MRWVGFGWVLSLGVWSAVGMHYLRISSLYTFQTHIFSSCLCVFRPDIELFLSPGSVMIFMG